MKHRIVILFLSLIVGNEASSQINIMEVFNRKSSELDIENYLHNNKSNLSSVICFLDTADLGYKNSVAELKKKSQDYKGQLLFVVVNFNSRSQDLGQLKFYGYQILESQFFIKSELFSLVNANRETYDPSYSNLPAEIKKIDLTKCLKDKKLSTLLASFLFPVITEVARETEEYSKELILIQRLKLLELSASKANQNAISNASKLDSLNRLIGYLNVEISDYKKSLADDSHSQSSFFLSAEIRSNVQDKYFNNYFAKASVGIDAFSSCQGKLFLAVNVGVQQSFDSWNSPDYSSSLTRVLKPNQSLDELIISGTNVTEAYKLKTSSCIIGAVAKRYIGNRSFHLGGSLSLSVPINCNLMFENKSGLFSYYGISNLIQDPLENIPDLGLVSNVTYSGFSSSLSGKLNGFVDYSFLCGLSFGKTNPFDLSLSIGYVSRKIFNLEKDYSAISSYFGEYNSLSAVNNTQISVPGFWNAGLSVRKYLN